MVCSRHQLRWPLLAPSANHSASPLAISVTSRGIYKGHTMNQLLRLERPVMMPLTAPRPMGRPTDHQLPTHSPSLAPQALNVRTACTVRRCTGPRASSLVPAFHCVAANDTYRPSRGYEQPRTILQGEATWCVIVL